MTLLEMHSPFYPPPPHSTLNRPRACAHGCRCFSVWVSAHTGNAPTGAETLQRFDLGQREKGSAAARALALPRCELENTAASIGAGGATREEKRAGGSVCIWRNHIIALLKVDFYFHFETLTVWLTDTAVWSPPAVPPDPVLYQVFWPFALSGSKYLNRPSVTSRLNPVFTSSSSLIFFKLCMKKDMNDVCLILYFYTFFF